RAPHEEERAWSQARRIECRSAGHEDAASHRVLRQLVDREARRQWKRSACARLSQHEACEAGAPWPLWTFTSFHICANPGASILAADFAGMLVEVLLGVLRKIDSQRTRGRE